MKEHSARQLWTALFVALLAPASALPAALSQGGGALVWLAPLLIFPGALAVLWAVGRLGSQGLAAAWRGRGPLLTLYYLWAMALSALTAGGCVDRLHRTDYGEAPAWLLSLALFLAAWWLTRRGPAAFFRAAQIFFLALVVVTALFFALGLARLRPENLALQGGGTEVPALGRGLFPAAGALAVGTLCAFFPWRKEPEGSRGWRWLAGWCAVAALLCLLVLGALGPELTASAPLPFFLTLQGLGLPGGLQRLEALGTAAWTLSDVTLLALAALAGREMAGARNWALWPVLLAGLVGGALLPNRLVAAFGPWLWGIDLVLGAAVPLVCALWRRISCGENGYHATKY